MRRLSVLVLLALAGCAGGRAPQPPLASVEPRQPPPPAVAARLTLAGTREQGGLLRGTAPADVTALTLDGRPVPLSPDRRFVIGLDRDAGPLARLVATRADGRQLTELVQVAPRQWDISRLPGLPKTPVPAPAFAAARPAELAQLAQARAGHVTSDGWRQDFAWPVTGRISTLFGSQRIYANGEAGSYHTGIDIARPTGTPVLAPADGVVIPATGQPFTLEGLLVLVAHGGGLESAFMHLSRIDVRAGDNVRRGQPLGLIGATGRATGPHLHWGVRWQGARIDPLLVAGPMPAAN